MYQNRLQEIDELKYRDIKQDIENTIRKVLISVYEELSAKLGN